MCNAHRSMPLARHAWVHGGVALRRQSCSQDQQRHARERGDGRRQQIFRARKSDARGMVCAAAGGPGGFAWCLREPKSEVPLLGASSWTKLSHFCRFEFAKAKNDLQKQTYVFSLVFKSFMLDVGSISHAWISDFGCRRGPNVGDTSGAA